MTQNVCHNPTKVIAAFIDILGFSNLIEQSEENWISAMARLEKIEKHVEFNFLDKISEGTTVRIFSDNIYISIPIEDSDEERLTRNIRDFLTELFEMQWYFINDEVFIRGGIAVGTQYVSDSTLFGTALLKAYRAESKVAKFPRIILDRSFTNLIDSLKDKKIPLLNLTRLYKKDDSGVDFLDYLLLWDDWTWDQKLKKEMFMKHRDIILNQLKNTRDKNILDKYNWVIRYHNTYAERYKCKIDL